MKEGVRCSFHPGAAAIEIKRSGAVSLYVDNWKALHFSPQVVREFPCNLTLEPETDDPFIPRMFATWRLEVLAQPNSQESLDPPALKFQAHGGFCESDPSRDAAGPDLEPDQPVDEVPDLPCEKTRIYGGPLPPAVAVTAGGPFFFYG